MSIDSSVIAVREGTRIVASCNLSPASNIPGFKDSPDAGHSIHLG